MDAKKTFDEIVGSGFCHPWRLSEMEGSKGQFCVVWILILGASVSLNLCGELYCVPGTFIIIVFIAK